MKIFGMLWIIVSLLLMGLGIVFLIFAGVCFTPTPLTIVKIVIGSIWTLGGLAMLAVVIKLLAFERMRSMLNRKK